MNWLSMAAGEKSLLCLFTCSPTKRAFFSRVWGYEVVYLAQGSTSYRGLLGIHWPLPFGFLGGILLLLPVEIVCHKFFKEHCLGNSSNFPIQNWKKSYWLLWVPMDHFPFGHFDKCILKNLLYTSQMLAHKSVFVRFHFKLNFFFFFFLWSVERFHLTLSLWQ